MRWNDTQGIDKLNSRKSSKKEKEEKGKLSSTCWYSFFDKKEKIVCEKRFKIQVKLVSEKILRSYYSSFS